MQFIVWLLQFGDRNATICSESLKYLASTIIS
jgi:hypothetical protein